MAETSETLAKLARILNRPDPAVAKANYAPHKLSAQQIKVGPIDSPQPISKDSDVVELAANPDWNPLDHPRGKDGKFVRQGTGLYLFGKTLSAIFNTPGGGPPKTVELDPGQELYRRTGNSQPFVRAADGTWSVNGKKLNPAAQKFAEGQRQTGKLELVSSSPAVPVPAASESDAQKALTKVKVGDTLTPAQVALLPSFAEISAGGRTYSRSTSGDWVDAENGKKLKVFAGESAKLDYLPGNIDAKNIGYHEADDLDVSADQARIEALAEKSPKSSDSKPGSPVAEPTSEPEQPSDPIANYLAAVDDYEAKKAAGLPAVGDQVDPILLNDLPVGTEIQAYNSTWTKQENGSWREVYLDNGAQGDSFQSWELQLMAPDEGGFTVNIVGKSESGGMNAAALNKLEVGDRIEISESEDSPYAGTWTKVGESFGQSAFKQDGDDSGAHVGSLVLENHGPTQIESAKTKPKSAPKPDQPKPVKVPGKKNKLTAADPNDKPDADGEFTLIKGKDGGTFDSAEKVVTPASGFIHPVSKESFPLAQGDQLLQHKLTPESFAVLGADGTKKFQVNKLGKKYKFSPHIPLANFKVVHTAQADSGNFDPDEGKLPDINQYLKGNKFTHPASGTAFKIAEGEQLLEHNFTPLSYLVVDAKTAEMKYKIDVKGKKQKAGTNLKPSNYHKPDVKPAKSLTAKLPTGLSIHEAKSMVQGAEIGDTVTDAGIPPVTWTKEKENWWRHSNGIDSISDPAAIAILTAQAAPKPGDTSDHGVPLNLDELTDYLKKQPDGSKLTTISEFTAVKDGAFWNIESFWAGDQLLGKQTQMLDALVAASVQAHLSTEDTKALELTEPPKKTNAQGVPINGTVHELADYLKANQQVGASLVHQGMSGSTASQLIVVNEKGSWKPGPDWEGLFGTHPTALGAAAKLQEVLSVDAKSHLAIQQPPPAPAAPKVGDEIPTAVLAELPVGLKFKGVGNGVSYEKTGSNEITVIGGGSNGVKLEISKLYQAADWKITSFPEQTKVESMAQKATTSVKAKETKAKAAQAKLAPVAPTKIFGSLAGVNDYLKQSSGGYYGDPGQAYVDIAVVLGHDDYPGSYYQSALPTGLGYGSTPSDWVDKLADPALSQTLQEIIANIDAAKKDKQLGLPSGEKTKLTTKSKKFAEMLKMAQAAQQLQAGEVPDYTPNSNFKWGTKKTWEWSMNNVTSQLKKAITEAQFKQESADLGWDPFNGTQDQYLDYLQGQGHNWAAYLTGDQLKDVALHYMQAPNQSMSHYYLDSYISKAKKAGFHAEVDAALADKNGTPFIPALQTSGFSFPEEPDFIYDSKIWTAIKYALSPDSKLDASQFGQASLNDFDSQVGPMAQYVPPEAKKALLAARANLEGEFDLQKTTNYLLNSGIWYEGKLLYEGEEGKFPLSPGMSVLKAPGGHLAFVPKNATPDDQITVHLQSGKFKKYGASVADGWEKVYAAPFKVTAADAKSDGVQFTDAQWDQLAAIEGTIGPEPLSGAEAVKVGKILQGFPAKPSELSLKARQLLLAHPDLRDLIVYKDRQGSYRVVVPTQATWEQYVDGQAGGFNSGAIEHLKKFDPNDLTVEQLDDLDKNQLEQFSEVLGSPIYDSGLTEPQLKAAVTRAASDWVEARSEQVPIPEAQVGVNSSLKPIPNMNLGGGRPKKYFADDDGNTYMAKPDNAEKFRPDTEHAASEIARMFGYNAPPTSVRKIDGQYSVIQPLLPASGDFSGKTDADLTDEQLTDALAGHPLDWAIANHDTHAGNFLTQPDGKVLKIDLGQAWKALGKDKLQVGWELPGNFGGVWYTKFYQRVQTGKIDKDRLDRVAKAVLTKANAISTRSDDAYRQQLDFAFANRTYYPPGKTKADFIEMAMKRKSDTFDDFFGFYKDLYAKGGYEFPWSSPEDLRVAKTDTDAHLRLSDEFASEVRQNNVHGKSLFFADDQIEDGHALFYTTSGSQGSTTLRGELKLRSGADATVSSWIAAQNPKAVSGAGAAPVAQNQLPETADLNTHLVAYAKTVATHASDGAYNESTVNTAKMAQQTISTQLSAIRKKFDTDPAFVSDGKTIKGIPVFQTGHQQQAWIRWAESWLSDFDTVQTAHQQQTMPAQVDPSKHASYTAPKGIDLSGKPTPVETLKVNGKTYTKYSDLNYVGSDGPVSGPEYESLGSLPGATISRVEPEAKVEQVSAPSKVYKVEAQKFSTPRTHPPDLQGVSTDNGRQTYSYGTMFKITSPDNPGVVLRYSPHDGNGYKHNYANAGLLQIEVTGWDGQETSMASTLDLVREMGVDLDPATETDLERQYWEQMSGILHDRKLDTKYAKVRTKIDAIDPAASSEDRVTQIKAAFAEVWGKDTVDSADYMPHFSDWRAPLESQDSPLSGRPYWMRPDFDVGKARDSWNDDLASLASRSDHHLTYLVSGGFASGEDKIRFLGEFDKSGEFSTYGTSTQDRHNGGSQFGMFRQGHVNPGGGSKGIYAEPAVLGRTSNWHVSHDSFGDVKEKPKVPFDLDASYQQGSGSDELLVKYGTSLFDDIAIVRYNSSSASERDKLVALLKNKGITEIRGIPIEERLVTTVDAARKTAKKVWAIARASEALKKANREATVGTIKSWDGVDYIKRANGEWVPAKVWKG